MSVWRIFAAMCSSATADVKHLEDFPSAACGASVACSKRMRGRKRRAPAHLVQVASISGVSLNSNRTRSSPCRTLWSRKSTLPAAVRGHWLAVNGKRRLDGRRYRIGTQSSWNTSATHPRTLSFSALEARHCCMGQEEDKQVFKAAKLAHAHDMIESLPRGRTHRLEAACAFPQASASAWVSPGLCTELLTSSFWMSRMRP